MSEEKKQEAEAQPFNDAELQDIMNEIESLEQEFSDEVDQSVAVAPEDETVEEVSADAPEEEPVMMESPDDEQSSDEASLDSSDDEEDLAFDADELESISAELDEEVEEMVEEVSEPVSCGEEPQNEVTEEPECGTNIEHLPTSHSSESESSPVHFEGNGHMNFKMAFDIAGEKAQLWVQDGSLKVVLKGVELTLEESGCHVSMDGGVTFSVPFSESQSHKKAA